MENQSQNGFPEKLDNLIMGWKNEGISLNPGITDYEISKIEARMSYCFEENFNSYLKKVNGFKKFELREDLFCYWSADKIIEENESGSHPKDVVWFSEYCINLCNFGFHRSDNKIYTHYQFQDNIILIAESFAEFIDVYIEDSTLLLR